MSRSVSASVSNLHILTHARSKRTLLENVAKLCATHKNNCQLMAKTKRSNNDNSTTTTPTRNCCFILGAVRRVSGCIRFALEAVLMHWEVCSAEAVRYTRVTNKQLCGSAWGFAGRGADRQWCACNAFTAINFYLNQTTDRQRVTIRRRTPPSGSSEYTGICGEPRAYIHTIDVFYCVDKCARVCIAIWTCFIA